MNRRRRDERTIWTPAKKAQARKLFGQVITLVAAAVEVPPDEFLRYVMHGEEPGTRARRAASSGASAETRASGKAAPAPILLLPPPQPPQPPLAAETAPQLGESQLAVGPEEAARPAGASPVRKGVKWPEDLARRFEELVGTMPIEAVAAELGVTVTQARSRAWNTGFRIRKKLDWTAERVEQLRAMAPTMSAAEIGRVMGGTEHAIAQGASRHGISLAKAGSAHGPVAMWTDERRARLAELAGKVPIEELLATLGVGRSSAHQEARRQGLSLRFRKGGRKARPAVAAKTAPQLAEVPVEGSGTGGAVVPAAKPGPKPKWSLERIAELRRLAIEEGLSASQIAAEMGETRNAVCGMAFRAGISLGKSRPTGRVTLETHFVPTVGAAGDWVNLRNRDGRTWLRMDGLGWVDTRANAYRCQRRQLKAVRAKFPLAAECAVVPEPKWRPRDIDYARGRCNEPD